MCKIKGRYIVYGVLTVLVGGIVCNYIGFQIPVEKKGPVTSQIAVTQDEATNHNGKSLRLLDDERRRASLVVPSNISEDVVKSLCGPSAIFSGLVGGNQKLAGKSFSDYVHDVDEAGNLSPLLRFFIGPGMDDTSVKAELLRLGIPSHRVWRYSGAQAADVAVREVDAGRLVLLVNVNSAKSFRLITKENYPNSGTRHIVRVAATYWDKAGRIEKVAVYDVNAYNGTNTLDADSRIVQFIDYQDFVRLLQVNIPDFGLVISDKSIVGKS